MTTSTVLRGLLSLMLLCLCAPLSRVETSAQEPERFRFVPVANSVLSNLATGDFWVVADAGLREIYAAGTDGNPGGIAVVDIASDQVVATIPGVLFSQASAIHTGLHRIYLTHSATDQVSIVDVAARRLLRMVGVGNGPAGVAVDPTGDRIYVVNERDGTMSILDPDGATSQIVPLGGAPILVGTNPARALVYVYRDSPSEMLVLDSNGILLASVPAASQGFLANRLTVHPGTNKAYLTSVTGPVVIVDGDAVLAGAADSVRTLALPGDPFIPALDPEAGFAYIIDHEQGERIWVLDAMTDDIVDSVTIELAPAVPCRHHHGAAVDPVTHRFYFACINSTIHLAHTVDCLLTPSEPACALPVTRRLSP